jgi:hypothetical protein
MRPEFLAAPSQKLENLNNFQGEKLKIFLGDGKDKSNCGRRF